MGPIRILIVDLDPKGCPEESSEGLARLLRSVPHNETIAVQTITDLPSETLLPAPDLILLRSPPIKDLSEMVRFLRKTWRTASIVGLFCAEKDTPTDVSQALGQGLDDFLACPLRDIDLFPWVRRFLQARRKTLITPLVVERQVTCTK